MAVRGVSNLGLLVSVGLTALMVPSAVMAQITQPIAAQEDEPDAGSEEQGLRTIVVTAERRGVDLQKVPISVSAIQAEDLVLRGLTEVKDLSAIAPNVSVLPGTTSGTAVVVSIRGIPSAADETQGYDSPIGVYLDGVFLARSSAASFEVAEIERVEVLRGPQGTLFGRNTTGGAINFITKEPPAEAGATIRGGIGNYASWEGKLTLNSGDLGGIRLSAAYLHKERDGVVQNPLERNDRKDPGSYIVDGARFAAQAFLGERVTITNTFDYTNYTGTPLAAQLSGVGTGVRRPNFVVDGNSFAPTQPANVAGYLANATVLEPGCEIQVVPDRRLGTICLNGADTSTDTIYGNMFRVLADLDNFTIRSTSAYRKWENTIRGSDLDGLGSLQGPLFAIGGPNPLAIFTGLPAATVTQFGLPAFLVAGDVPTVVAPLFQANNERNQEQFSQEIELISDFGGDFEFVLGGFYFEESGFETNAQRFGVVIDVNQAVYNAANLEQVLLGFGYSPAVAAATAPVAAAAFQAGNPAPQRFLPLNNTLTYTAAGKSYAVYGQGAYRTGGPDGALGFTLGLRYTWDEKEFTRTQNGPVPFTNPIDIANNDQKKSFSSPTGNFTVDYRASDDINMFARVARGYRSGGFNARQATNDQAGNPTLPLLPFGQETIWAYEAGIKGEFFNRLRVNLAGFYNVYSDQLVALVVPIEGSGSFGTVTVNAGETTYAGIELEGQFAVTDELTLDGSFGYVKSETKEFPGTDINGNEQNVASLTDAPYAPEYTANISATYSTDVQFARLVARVGYNYTSGFSMFPNVIAAPFRDETNGDARGLVDVQFSLSEIQHGSADFTITAWAKNLTNEEYVARAVDFGQLGFSHSLYGEPRTYGITVTAEF